MMNEIDRKKVFWLLKKYSSYTAWQALGDAYAEFVAAWEYAMTHAKDVDVDNQNIGWTKKILDAQIAFEKGLPLLREGQRSVFRNTSTGYLNNTYNTLCRFIRRIMDPEEFVFDWMPNMDEVIAAEKKFQKFTAVFVITEQEPEDPAPFRSDNALNPDWHPCVYPINPSSVPNPTDLTIQTEDDVPQSGIWEPEWEISPGLLKSLTGTPAKTEKGCMNYLLAGTVAPKYKDGELEPEIEVTWRLIWADHRYQDGIIPEEEAEYLAETAATQPQDQPAAGTLRGLPDELVPQTGWWWSPAFTGTDGLRHFTQGEHFPSTKATNYGGVIWYYDAERQPKE